ncbi:MAG: hydrogenase expression protein HypE [Rhodospirillaceae bacterium]
MTKSLNSLSPPALEDYLGRDRRTHGHAPWPQLALGTDTWMAMIKRLAGSSWVLLGEWADGLTVRAALCDDVDGYIAVLSIDAIDGHYPTLSQARPPAIRLERAIADLSGLVADGLTDLRPWLDHGVWPVSRPLGDAAHYGPVSRPLGDAAHYNPALLPHPYAFLPVEGEGLHEIPVGPVHAGIIEPGHFRFTCFGETVVRLEDRLGYAHKGVEALMVGATPLHSARIAGRVSGDSTVAYACAFCRAVEAATGTDIPQRAHWLRALMAELERIANHFGDIGAVCNDVAFSLMHAHCGVLRETVLRAADACFGHRLMMDRVVPGGVAADLDDSGVKRLRALVVECRGRFEQLVWLYENTPSLQARMHGSGTIKPELVRAWGAGGFVGRAAGRDFDARSRPGYPPYDQLDLVVPVRQSGDVNARVMIRIEEVRESLRLIEQILNRLPAGPLRVELALGRGEGMALVESFRGDVLAWLRLAQDGTIARCHLRDPSWFQWPLLMVAIEGAPVADFPLCNKSFNCSYSGHDL